MMPARDATPRPSSRLVLAFLAGASWLFSGCAIITTNHYILKARGETMAPPILPALNTAGKEGYASIGFRLGQQRETDANLQARFNGDTTYGADPFTSNRIDVWHTSPGNYVVSRTRFNAGLDLRGVVNRHFDIFLSGNLGPKALQGPYSGLIGFGVTFTTPVVHFRVAPAAGMHRYSTVVTDSVNENWNYQGTIDDFDTTYVRQVRDRKTDNFGAISFSAWLPENLVGPVKPYVQYQYQTIYIQSDLLVKDALTVNGSVWVAGLNWEVSKAMAMNLAVSRETLFNDLSEDAFYKGELGVEFKFRE
jgi:hypothetical protein